MREEAITALTESHIDLLKERDSLAVKLAAAQKDNESLKAKLAQVQQDLGNANRESLNYKNIYARTFESYKGLLADQKVLQADLDNWVKVFGADPKAAITREFAKERQSRIEAQTKLAQVEADAAAMRDFVDNTPVFCDCQSLSGKKVHRTDCRVPRKSSVLAPGSGQRLLDELAQAKKEIDQLNKALALKLDAMPSGLSAGQSMKLERELAQLRTTAQRRLELLRKCEWRPEQSYCEDTGFHKCRFCDGMKEIHGHKHDCPLAAELKEPR